LPEKLWVVGLVLVVAIPGAWHLGRPSFWNDEAATWAIGGHGFGDLLHVLRTSGGDRGAALYYGMAFVWMRTFGTSELALRSLSLVAAGTAMVPFHACARRLTATPAAWAADAVLATSSFLLAYARDARAYSLAMLSVVVAVWMFLRAMESQSARDWWIFTFLAATAIYVHWFSALVVVALFVALFAWGLEGRLRDRARTSVLALAVMVLPIVAVLLGGTNTGVDWIAPLNVAELRALVSQFTGTSSPVLQVLVAIPLVVGLVAACNASLRHRAPPIAVMWFVLPVGLTILISIVKPLLVARYLIVTLPAFALLVGLGVFRLARGRPARVAAMALALVVLGSGNLSNLSNGEDWRAIVATIGQRAHSGDAILVFPATAVSSFSYYARDDPRLRRRAGPTWPQVRWDSPFTRSLSNAAVLRTQAIGASVVWLVIRAPHGGTVAGGVQHSPVLASLQKQLEARFASAATVAPWHAADTVFVVRYSQPRPTVEDIGH
jgi:mannosyltransferase